MNEDQMQMHLRAAKYSTIMYLDILKDFAVANSDFKLTIKMLSFHPRLQDCVKRSKTKPRGDDLKRLVDDMIGIKNDISDIVERTVSDDWLDDYWSRKRQRKENRDDT